MVNAISNWVALFITVIVGFILTPYVIGRLGKTGYGLWTLISSIIGYYGVLDLGVTSAISRYVAHYNAQADDGALKGITNTSLAIFCGVGFFVICISFTIAKPLSTFFNVPIGQIKEFQHVVWLLGLTAGLGFPGNLFGAIIRSHERFVAANCVSVITTLMRAGLTVLFLSRGMGLVGVAYSNFATEVVMIVLNFTLCRLFFSYFELQLRWVRWNALLTLLAFGAPTIVIQVADILRFNLDSFVIGKWVNIEGIAVYGVAAFVMRFFLEFVAKGTQTVFTPRFAALNGAGEIEHLRQLFLKSLSAAAFLSFAAGTLIIILGKQFIVLWVGTNFLDAVPVLWVLAISYSLALAQTPGISLVYAFKKHYLFAVASIIEGIANLALSIYLASLYGILGVAVGTSVPMLVVKLFLQPFYVSRVIGIPILQYWRQLTSPLGIGVSLIFISHLIPQSSLIGGGFFSLGVYGMPYLMVFAGLFVVTNMISHKRRVLGGGQDEKTSNANL